MVGLLTLGSLRTRNELTWVFTWKNGPAAATGVGLATIALIVLEDTVAVAEFIRICDYAFEAGNVLRHIEQRLPRNLKHGFAIRLAQQIGFGFWKRLAAFIRIERVTDAQCDHLLHRILRRIGQTSPV